MLQFFLVIFSTATVPPVPTRPPTAAPPRQARVAYPASNANKGCLVSKKVATPATTDATDATATRIIFFELFLFCS